jgi:3-dehydroquinate dehydratase / shikimate dehydrogenase
VPVRVCVSICEPTTSGAVEAASRVMEWADLVEIRADYIQDLDLVSLLREKTRPVIFTLRAAHEGGRFDGAERARLETILEAARLGADYVDVEYSAFWQAVLEAVPRQRVILSHHNFEQTPEGLETLVETMAATGAGVLKVATRARCLADNLRIAGLLSYAASRKIKLSALAMGREGIPSRILGAQWGSWMNYASLPGGEPGADGQIPADELSNLYRVRRIGVETKLYGVLGKPLGHSLSPQIHNAAFNAERKNAVYMPLEGTGIDDFLEFNASFPFQGLSVTIPYKEEACSRASSLSVEAHLSGAVNTLIRKRDGWHGENTDIDGFTRPLRRRMHIGRIRAVVLGGGGAARAVVCALRTQNASVCVVTRDPAKGRQLAEKLDAESESWEKLPNMRWDLLVNATPVGMYPNPDQSPVPAEWLTGKWVYDLVYNPRETKLLKDAAARGCNTVSGFEMFLGQALKQQQLWSGTPPPESVMREALETALSKRKNNE